MMATQIKRKISSSKNHNRNRFFQNFFIISTLASWVPQSTNLSHKQPLFKKSFIILQKHQGIPKILLQLEYMVGSREQSSIALLVNRLELLPFSHLLCETPFAPFSTKSTIYRWKNNKLLSFRWKERARWRIVWRCCTVN